MTKPLVGIASDLYEREGRRARAFAYTTYIEALRQAGAIPVIVPPQPENAREVVEALDGLLLAGGKDCDPAVYRELRHETVEPMDPRRQDNDLNLARAARDRDLPTLGICLGLQMMNVAAGGTLVQDIDSQLNTDIRHASDPEDRGRHPVAVEKGTRLDAILGARELDVNSSHHQAIKNVGAGLRVTAHAPDGVVEGVEDPQHPFYIGVQWHPEDMAGEDSALRIFRAFVEAARRHGETRVAQSTEMSPARAGESE